MGQHAGEFCSTTSKDLKIRGYSRVGTPRAWASADTRGSDSTPHRRRDARQYTKPLRHIAVYNEQHGDVVELLINIDNLAASSIASLYRSRWFIEIFFRNSKQRLSIKSFLGTTRNAVEVQIWTALITMLLMVFLKSIAKYRWCLSNLVSSLQINTFTKIDLMQWLNEPFTHPPETKNQLF